VITATQAPEKYLEIFDQFNNRADAGQPRWLQSLQQDAFARFSETGFPTTHDEDWRFTNVAAVANTPFELASLETVSSEQLEPFGASKFACCLVFVNGLFSQELSNAATLPEGVTAGSLAAQIKNNPASAGNSHEQSIDRSFDHDAPRHMDINAIFNKRTVESGKNIALRIQVLPQMLFDTRRIILDMRGQAADRHAFRQRCHV